MKKNSLLFMLCSAMLLTYTGKAQATLLHYWHFNSAANATAQYYLPTVQPIDADYSIMDTSKAQLVYQPMDGVSANYISYYDFNGGDTINVRLGHEADTPNYSFRPRNPSDSMELRCYIPTTGYKNIMLSFEAEASSTGNGAKTHYFDYSLDSGLTWKTSGMSVLSVFPGITYPAQDSIEASWGKVQVTFDSTVNNTDKFVVRLKFGPANTGNSGNDRFDNVAVDGDTLNSNPPPPPPPLDTSTIVHYWHFNTYDTAYNNPGIPPIYPDSTITSAGQARLVYALDQGTSSTYRGYLDPVAGTPINARYNTPAGTGLRVRNPTDSMTLLLYIPTKGFKNIRVNYATETSSLTHGPLQQNIQYSTDMGLTYRTGSLNMSSVTTQANWSLVALNFGSDTTVNNNDSLVLMMTFAGNTTDSNGNNRFDNIVVEGDSVHGPTGVHSVLGTPGFCSLYPNPANSSIYINTPAAGSKTVSIYNVAGEKVYMAAHSEQKISLSVNQLATGTYYILVHDNKTGTDYTLRFVKD